MVNILALGTAYHQYDFFVYPAIRKTLTRGWVTKKLPGNIPTVETFTPSSTEEMVKQCLSFYLQPYKNILLCGYDENFQIEEFVRQVYLIVEQHHTFVIQYQDCVYHVAVEGLKSVRILVGVCELKW